MQKTDETPFWVFLAFSSIETRRGALILLWSSMLFTVYCIPWVTLFQGHEWVEILFLIDDWSWVAMMLPMSVWYWLCLRWVDKKNGWVI